ncbi:hypothetical protein [Amycolatopsis sp. M39]|nr:hypothetical protein [Amycolatopsis sp. M39]
MTCAFQALCSPMRSVSLTQCPAVTIVPRFSLRTTVAVQLASSPWSV